MDMTDGKRKKKHGTRVLFFWLERFHIARYPASVHVDEFGVDIDRDLRCEGKFNTED